MTEYKNSSGKYLTKALFFELSLTPHTYAIFTTKNEDHEYKGVTYRSFKKWYLEIADPTEYKTAAAMVGGWDHWLDLDKCVALKPLMKQCRDELEVRLRSDAVDIVLKDSKSEDSKSAVASAKWLSDKGYAPDKSKATRSPGRPKKAAVSSTDVFDNAGPDKDTLDELKRIGMARH